ncbi:hypothetical protein HHK36_011365 [Tetracentron sinense]|uniref:Nuclease HARBI1 n=1 Tax=Tetracentron sinense TaxID=13715 RepID=A0A835DKC7_TETSI|nr:hypothetical protein HHK36_011365 [Tetracentron sinense]
MLTYGVTADVMDDYVRIGESTSIESLKDIMKACIIMHNMIVKDKRDVYTPDLNYDAIDENITVSHERTVELLQIIQNHRRIRDRGIHSQLQADLVEHLWQLQGTRMNV